MVINHGPPSRGMIHLVTAIWSGRNLQVSLGAPWQLPVVPPGERRRGARWKMGGDEPISLNDNWGYP